MPHRRDDAQVRHPDGAAYLIEYRERKGRGKTCEGRTLETLKRVWLEAGCPCLPYFRAQIAMWVDEYSAHVAAVPDSTRALLLRMSDRTMSRALAGEICIKPGWPRANRRSGRNGANEDKGDGPRRLRREDHGVQRPAGRHPGRHIRAVEIQNLWLTPPLQVTAWPKRARPYEGGICPRRRRRKAASIRAVPARGMKEFFGMGAC